MKMLVQRAMKSGAQGIRVECSGRLAGAEIARREWYREGRVPLHTFRADIHYAVASAYTLYGIIGIKVWVFLGEVVAKQSDIAPTITTVKA
jgi:small subunit ribosomal protein S3